MRVREHIRRNWNLRFPVFHGMLVLLITTILITLTNADAIAFADISSTFATDVSGADRSKNRDPSAQLSADIAQQPGSDRLKIEWKKSYKPIGNVEQCSVPSCVQEWQMEEENSFCRPAAIEVIAALTKGEEG